MSLNPAGCNAPYRRTLSLFSFLLLIFPLFGWAQDSTKTMIRAGRLFDPESGRFVSDMAILVRGENIDSVLPFKSVTPNLSSQYRFIDLSGYAVMPGLIDAHTHLLNKEVFIPDNHFGGMDMLKTVTMQGEGYRAIYGAVRAKAYLEAGITAVQDLGNSGLFGDISLRRAIDDRLVPGPRMRCAGPGLSSEGGQMPGLNYRHRDLVNNEYRIVKGVADAVQAVRENVNQGADVIKIYSNNTPNVTALSVEEMQAIVKEAHRYGIRVTAHATDNQAVYNAVISGVDCIEHGYRIDDTTLALMARKGVLLTPTVGDFFTHSKILKALIAGLTEEQVVSSVGDWKRGDSLRLQQAIRNKVTIVGGSDDYVDLKLPLAQPSIRNLIGYYECGMPIPEVLRSATLHAARQLNWSKKTGVIKAGFWADIVAFDLSLENNIEALLKVRFVMKAGQVYVGDRG